MSEDRNPSEESLTWLTYAQEDWRAAKVLLKTEKDLTKQICYHSQQTAEKALKASLIFLQIEFPFTHNLDTLRNRLPKEWKCVQDYPELSTLTDWAVDGRYPGGAKEPSEKESKEAFRQASGILASIRKDLAERGLSPEK